MYYFLLLNVLKNSLPHLVDLFVIYTGTSHPFEFSSLVSHLYPTVCLRSPFLSILLCTIVCQQQQQSKASGKKRIANWFWSLYLINVQREWMVGNNETHFFPHQKELSRLIQQQSGANHSQWIKKKAVSGTMTPTLDKNRRMEMGTMKRDEKCISMLCVRVRERARRTTTAPTADALRFSSPEKLLRMNFN